MQNGHIGGHRSWAVRLSVRWRAAMACKASGGGAHGGGVFIGVPTVSAAPGRARPGAAFFQDAFRPFYLGAAVFAAVAVPLWLAMWRGAIPPTDLPPLFWHAHEMVYGFAVAVIIGFLFTAARNWTGLPLPGGLVLGSMFALWLGGRLGMALWYGPVTAAADVALLLIVASVLGRKFARARSWSNLPLVGVLSFLVLANAAFHAGMLGLLEVSPLRAVEAGVACVVVVELIVGGRVVPAFTASAVPGVRQWRRRGFERAVRVLAAVALAGDVVGLPAAARGVLAIAAAAGLAVQIAGWNPLASRRRPVLWILHVSYAWIPAGLFLLGLAAFGVVTRTAAMHALSVGSMAGLILGMMTRTSLGHTGRVVHAGWAEVTAYVLVIAAAGLRVGAALAPAFYGAGMMLAGAAWTAAFVVFAAAYAPVLLRPRIPMEERVRRPAPARACAAGPGGGPRG